MRTSRTAFTLIELLISISILTIMMLYLYKSYTSLNISNEIIKKEGSHIQRVQKFKKVIYLDFLLALHKTINLKKREKNEDFVSLQSSHSIHKRYNPYVAYIVKEEKLYRLESLTKISTYEVAPDIDFDIDYIGEVKNFRVYKSSKKKKESYLVHIDFKSFEDVLLKVNVLNEY